MGSPLTLTMANCYMFFFERPIARQVKNSSGLYLRYIDDLFITINWPQRHLLKQIENWNQFDINIKLEANINQSANFLDLHIENKNGQASVWIVDATTNLAKRRVVTLGTRKQGDLREVVSGLAIGEKVVRQNRDKLTEGTRVRIQGVE